MPTWTTMNNLSTGDLVTEADMDALRGNIEYLLDPNRQRLLRNNGGAYSTTSTAFVDVDATNLAATITTNGGPVLVMVSAVGYVGNTGAYLALDVAVDGTRLAAAHTGGLISPKFDVALSEKALAFAVLATGLAGGTHTFKLQWRVSAGTGYLQSDSGCPVHLGVIEL